MKVGDVVRWHGKELRIVEVLPATQHSAAGYSYDLFAECNSQCYPLLSSEVERVEQSV